MRLPVKERLILRNPTEDCITPKVQKVGRMQILKPEHSKDYLAAADKRGLLPMFYLELVTGLRKGELTALLWSDLDVQSRTIANLHKKILKDAGLPHIRFHDLRHTFATLSLKYGVDVKTLSGALGHYDAGFTLSTYTHATAEMQRDAADTIGSVVSQAMIVPAGRNFSGT